MVLLQEKYQLLILGGIIIHFQIWQDLVVFKEASKKMYVKHVSSASLPSVPGSSSFDGWPPPVHRLCK
jgi:hypothetical protein